MSERLIVAKDLYYLSVVALLAVGDRLPPRARDRLAGALGGLAYHTSRAKRHLVESNVAKAFGPDRERAGIVRAAFREVWREMLSWSEPPPRDGVAIVGLEHLRRAHDAGRGAILWESAGFGRRFLAKQALHAVGVAVHQIHGPNNLGGLLADGRTRVRDALVRRFFDRRERRFVADVIDLPDSDSLAFTRDLLRRLARNAVLCISGDGRGGQRLVPLRFLGRTTLFAPGMVSLARLSGAPLLPAFCLPGNGGGHRLVIEPPIRIERQAEREEQVRDALEQYAALLEARIRRHPELYRNWHLLGELLDDRGELAR